MHFTVIIPTYNRTQFIREAVRSVYAQTFSDWELLIVDDGSDVPAIEFLEDFAGHPNFTYHYQKNRGLGAARQVGAELARGKYICYLDDDDYYLENHLATLFGAMERSCHKLALYKTGLIRLYPDGSQQHSALYDPNAGMMEQHWTLMDGMFSYAIPRSVALQIPSVQYYFCEDFNWLGRLMTVLSVVQIPAFTLVYRWHGDNRTGAITQPSALRGAHRAVEALYGYPGIKEAVRKSTFQRMMAHQALHYARACVRQGHYGLALHGIRRSIPYAHPRTWFELGYTFYFIGRQAIFRSSN